MKFTLKDYQAEAVQAVLVNLKKAHKRWHEDGDRHAFSLTATTGAGKTVMAAAVFEALFYGNDDFDLEPDPGAVVIWFSDDPSLNEQSRFRLLEASDKLNLSQLVTVESSFARERFEPGKIYFLNTAKLSKNSLLVRGHEAEDDGGGTDGPQLRLLPDARAYSIWDTIQNTIEDPALTLYLALDEAHRGMRPNTQGTQTLVTKLINGFGSVPGIPVVWGISATVERFNQAMAQAANRATLPNVIVDPKKVQESGLLKDTINLDVADEEGDLATVLLRRGATKLMQSSQAWADYARQQGSSQIVLPLMVLQVPNSPDPAVIGGWLHIIFETWPELPNDCVANVFGEHRTENFAGYSVPYIPPERVQDDTWVRILLAKDAISTGWDCPRAEVMVSFRAATDKTFITQLLGRMVRTPLARRIPGNERLNAVDCLLPHFNRNSVTAVVEELMTGSDSGEPHPGRRVLINPREMGPNPSIAEPVWEKLLTLPSQHLPKRQARPVKRLTALAHELASDGLLPHAGKIAHAEMHKVLDAAAVRYAADIENARKSVLTVEGVSVRTDVETGGMSFNDFVEEADYAVIEDAYKRACRVISPDLARTYSEHLADQAPDDEDPEEALVDAHTDVAAMGLVPELKEYLDNEAEKLANQWLQEYRIAIKGLSDERQDEYREIREMSADPLDVDLARPRSWLQPTRARDPDGTEVALPRYEKHLLCDQDGLYPELLNDWEQTILATEMARAGFVAWYRNPSRPSQDSLGITYEDGEVKILRPDFIFFAEQPVGSIVADIVDPHGHHLADALPKLKGLAAYAEANGQHYRRIEAVADLAGSLRVLDMQEASTRKAVLAADSAKALYESGVAADFVP
jgi:hypothetical protein